MRPFIPSAPVRAAAAAAALAALLGVVPGARSVVQQAPPRPVERVPFLRLAGDEAWKGAAGVARRGREERRRAAAAERLERMHETLGAHRVSRRGLAQLAARGLGPARRPGAKAADGPTPADPDTLRVLLVRIGFATDRSGDLTSVTTDGDFQLTPDPSVRIDPPPHDRAFFESHLYGLSEFYRFQSGGRLVIDGRVLPAGDTDCYRLGDLADYGPGADAFWTIEGLESLVRDMIGAADAGMADDGLDLSDWSDDDPFTYVIFVHAGSDWQSDVNGDSPNDVPTFFVTLGEGEPLQGGGTLTECSVIPETTTQDGYLGSIAAGLYHEFGHALGLVDVYDTYRGLTRTGVWTLMDSGTNLAAAIGFPTPTPGNPDSVEVEVVTGLLPPSLGAWDKWFLGWLETESAGGAWEATSLPAVQVRREDYPRYRAFGYDFRVYYPQALIGGVSPREFFLVENRWVPLGAGELPENDGVFLVRDAQTGVILYLGGDDPDGDGPLPPRNTGMYDYFLPDGGLLVWHVNQARIEPALADNTINTDGDGLVLVEADGIRDIGTIEPYVLGFYGSARDPFHAGRDGSPQTSVTLGQEGAPSSRAHDRSWTGFMLRDISANEAVMTFAAVVAPTTIEGPIALPDYDADDAAALGGAPGPRALDPASVTPLDLPGADGLLLADARDPAWGDTTFTAWGATLFALRTSGNVATPAPPGLPAGAIHRFGAALAGPPAVLPDLAPEGYDLVVAAARDGEIAAFATTAVVATALAPLWTADVGDTLAFGPVAMATDRGAGLLWCVQPDTVVWMTPGGALAPSTSLAGFGRFLLPPRVARRPDGDLAVAVLGSGGWATFRFGSAAALCTAPADYDLPPGVQPAAAALVPTEEGVLLVVAGDDGTLVALAGPCGAGAVWDASRWPSLDGAPVGELAVADLDADGRDDLIGVTPERVHAFSARGVPLRGFPVRLSEQFPLAADTRFAGPVVVCDTGVDGRNELFVTTTRGHLLGFDAAGRLLARTPFLWGGEPASGLVVAPAISGGGRTLWLADAGGRTAPPLARRWLPGRAVGYQFLDWGNAVEGTSEWLGALGGPQRAGPVGAPFLLAEVTPLRDERERVVLYPNPAREERVTVRFWSETAAPARVVLHDLAGEIVAEADAPASAGVMNEYEWRLPPLASGIYLVRVEADGPDGRRRWLTRLAVER